MSDQYKKTSASNFSRDIWGKRAEGLPVIELDVTRRITHDDVLNLLQKYAFVQVINPESSGEYEELKFIKVESGWIILDYGPAMSTSPGELLFNDIFYTVTEEGDLKRICTGTGTRIKQIVDTGTEIVILAAEKNWPGIRIVDGYDLLNWSIWKSAQVYGMTVSGYTPTKADIAKYEQIKVSCPSLVGFTP
jgi:hypothetical protein